MKYTLYTLYLGALTLVFDFVKAAGFSEASEDDKKLIYWYDNCLGIVDGESFISTFIGCPKPTKVNSFLKGRKAIPLIAGSYERESYINRYKNKNFGLSSSTIDHGIRPNPSSVSVADDQARFGFRKNGGLLEYVELKRLSHDECKARYKIKRKCFPEMGHVVCASAALHTWLSPGSPILNKRVINEKTIYFVVGFYFDATTYDNEETFFFAKYYD